MIKGTIKGFKSLEAKLNKMEAEIKGGQVEAVAVATLRLHEEAVKLIQNTGDGTPQIRYGPKRVVNASNPFDPPNTDTGRLVQSIKMDFIKKGLTGRVGSNLKYAAWLEFGTKNMAPRPWLSLAVDNVSKEVADIFSKAVDAAIKKGTK